MAFSLISNPFAVLAADPMMSGEALADLAAREGTPQAAAALHTLTAPRTRLAAELAFLPGAAARAGGIVQQLRREARPDLDGLPDPARANVLAHLCDAQLAEGADPEALVAAQIERGSPALLDLVAADRRTAGFPAPDPGMVVAAQDELAEAHAAALVRACLHRQGAAERLATLMRREDWRRPTAARAFLRRAAAVWARETAGQATAADEAVGRAEAALSRAPGEAAAEAFTTGVRAWAELTAPERLADAAAGLDHEASAAKARRWRGLTQRLAEQGDEPLAAMVAEALVEALGDLPGFATLLRRDRDTLTAAVRDRALTAAFEPLQALAQRLGEGPSELSAALLAREFGPQATGAAAELWAAFQRAREAAPGSERPFVLLDQLAARLDASGASGAALVLLKALADAAESAGLDDAGERLRAHERVLLRRAGLAKLQSLTAHWRAAGRAVREIDRLLPLADDPALRAQLSATRQRMQRRVAAMASSLAVGCAVLVLAVIGVSREMVEGPGAPTSGATTTATVPAYQPPTTSNAPVAQADAPAGTPLAAAEPQAGAMPADAPAAPAVLPDASPAPQTHEVPAITAFGYGTPSEEGPLDDSHVFRLDEVRYCLFTEFRLNAIRDKVKGEAARSNFNEYARPWQDLCGSYDAHRADIVQVRRELKQYRPILSQQAQRLLDRL